MDDLADDPIAIPFVIGRHDVPGGLLGAAFVDRGLRLKRLAESANFHRPLDEIDFQAIADHWLARFSGYRR
jgi:hypothetical protein